MKKLLSNLIFYVVLAVVVSASVWPELSPLVNIAHVSAWLFVGIMILAVLLMVFMTACVSYLESRDKLEESVLSWIRKQHDRSALAKAMHMFRVIAFTIATAAAGWTVAAWLYAALSLVVSLWFVYMHATYCAKTATA